MNIKLIIQFLLSFLRTIYLFEAKKNIRHISYNNLKLKKFTNIKSIKELWLKSYLKKNNKDSRFNQKQILLVLYYKDEIVCLGWMYIGSKWLITEIGKEIIKKNSIILFDFFTRPKFRNKGFYRKILNLIRNFNSNKKFIIYSLKSNKQSVKAILKAKFKLVDQLRRW